MNSQAKRDRAWPLFVEMLLIVDVFTLVAAFAIANIVFPGRGGVPQEEDLMRLAAFMAPLFIALFCSQGLYRRRYLLGGTQEYNRVTTACTYGAVALIGVSYFGIPAGGNPLVSRSSLIVFWVLSVLLACAARFTMRRVAYWMRRREVFITRVLIAGVDMHSTAIARQLDAPLQNGTRIVGFVDDFLPEGSEVLRTVQDGQDHTIRVLGSAHRAPELAEALDADLIIVNPQPLAWETCQSLLAGAARLRSHMEIRLVPLPYDALAASVETASVGYVPLLRLQGQRITGLDSIMKRMLDLSVAAGGLLLASPFVVSYLVRARMRGTTILTVTQPVVGRGRRLVPLTLFTREVTPHLLRGWPTLWQVLKGGLSIVGPRPRLQEEQHELGPWAGVVQAVNPGLVGPWRLLSNGSPYDPHQQLMQDLWYIRNYTIWQDLFLLSQSLRALVPLPRSGQRLQMWRWQPRDDQPARRLTISRVEGVGVDGG